MMHFSTRRYCRTFNLALSSSDFFNFAKEFGGSSKISLVLTVFVHVGRHSGKRGPTTLPVCMFFFTKTMFHLLTTVRNLDNSFNLTIENEWIYFLELNAEEI